MPTSEDYTQHKQPDRRGSKMQEEAYSNPIAPDTTQKLTNEDFRRLLATPRPSATASNSSLAQSGRRKSEDEKGRKAKKPYIPKAVREEQQMQAELSKKYRDRAKERRDGVNPDYQDAEDTVALTSGYKAVAPVAEAQGQAEAIRRRAIDESKFLGGDMKHTHLVKGLDYVLKQKKVESIAAEKKEDEESRKVQQKKEKDRREEIKFHTAMAKNIYRTLFVSHPPARNELFAPGRMAYVFELDEEYAESDIPTTLIRSKADCPQAESQSMLTTNDIVINKLTQILSYLRTGARAKKSKKKDKGHGEVETEPAQVKAARPGAVDQGIWDNLGDYVFNPEQKSAVMERKDSYFPQPEHREEMYQPPAAKDLVKALASKYDRSERVQVGAGSGKEKAHVEAGWSAADLELRKQLAGEEGEVGGRPKDPEAGGQDDKGRRLVGLESNSVGTYAECYPGAMEEYDATYDSDEEVDFSKMDMGNKKGPVKRWDFENEEDYEHYQSKREALPKAAFQYGVKMNEGRKTRRSKGGKNEMAKINRQWQKISAIIANKSGSGGGGDGPPSAKKAKE